MSKRITLKEYLDSLYPNLYEMTPPTRRLKLYTQYKDCSKSAETNNADGSISKKDAEKFKDIFKDYIENWKLETHKKFLELENEKTELLRL